MNKEDKKDKLLKQLKRNEFFKKHRLGLYFGGALTLMLASMPGMVLDSIALTWGFFTPAMLILIFGGLDVYAIGDDRFIAKRAEISKELSQLGYNVTEVIDDKTNITTLVEKSKSSKKSTHSIHQIEEDKLIKTATKRAKDYVKNTNNDNIIGL